MVRVPKMIETTQDKPRDKILTPRQRQRLAEDAIAGIEERYNVRILGVIKTVNGGQQVITWEVVALPDKEAQNPPGGHEA